MATYQASLGLAHAARRSQVGGPAPGRTDRPFPRDGQVGPVTPEQWASLLGNGRLSPESPATAPSAPSAHGCPWSRRRSPARPEPPSLAAAWMSSEDRQTGVERVATFRPPQYTDQVTVVGAVSRRTVFHSCYARGSRTALPSDRSGRAPSTPMALPRPAHRAPRARSP